MKIPIATNLQEDRIIWSGEENGSYSVKSSYRMLRGENTANSSFHWTHIWKMNLPPKVKSFVWQACSNLLPTVDNLQNRRVECSQACILCSNHQESISHLMFKCGFAISCLKNIPNILLNVDMSMEEWVSWHIKALDNVSCCLLLTTCWKIWGARNQKLWSNYSSNPSIVVEDAKAFFEAWSSIHTYSPRRNKQKDFEKWEKPPRSWLKVNTDAALDSQGRHIGLGFVLRNSDGNFIAAATKHWRGNFQPKLAEAIGVREALKWLKDMQYDNIQVETDALLVIKGLNNATTDSSFDLVLEDIRLIANDFHNISFAFVKRSANSAAHVLAREAVFNADCRDWLSSPPSFLYDVLVSDSS